LAGLDLRSLGLDPSSLGLGAADSAMASDPSAALSLFSDPAAEAASSPDAAQLFNEFLRS
jgi:hypothetical protein